MRRRQRQLLAASLLMGTAVSLSAPYVTGQAVPAPAVGPAPATQPVIVAATQPTTQPTTQPLVVATTQPTTQPTTRSSASTPHIVLQPGGRILLNFKEASIDSVLDELSAVAGYTIYRQVKPEGRVNLDSKGKPLSAEEAITALNMVLNDRGYAAIQQGRMLKIMTRDKARKANIPVRKGSDPKEIAETDELITQVIPLAYVDATQLKADLAPLVNPEADFTANASSNALIMTDTSANIRRVVEIVNELDKQLADATEVKVFQLKYASAANAAKLVNDLFGAQAIPGGGQGRGGGGGGQGRGGGGFGGFGGGGFGGGGFGGGGFGGGGFGGAPGGAPGAAAAAGGAQSSRRTARVTASSDDRTNTLVVTGPTAVLTVVAQVVKELDANPTSDDSVFVYRLKNAQSLNIEAVVNNLFNGTNMARGSSNSQTALPNRSSTLGGSSARTGSSGTGSTTANRSTGSSTSGFGGSSGRTGFGGASASTMNIASQLAGQVTIIADPDTNSLLVRTSPKNWDQVKDILKELDRPVAQVLIKVLIAEVTHDNETDVGAEFSALNIRASGLGQKGGTAFGQAAQAAAGNGASVQILETNFNATIRALETAGKLDVLSRPYILASDNQLASIIVGQEVPRITDSRTTDTGQTINTIQYDTIGIILDVIPHINPEGLVILDVAPQISAVTGTTVPISETLTVPVYAQRSAQTRVGIRNGQTVVIGGLMQDQLTETVNKVPLLGDIPLVGNLFKHTDKTKTKTELLVFLTPHVASDPDYLEGMSKDEMTGTKLVPGAVVPGAFDDQRKGLDLGHVPSTQPASQLITPK